MMTHATVREVEQRLQTGLVLPDNLLVGLGGAFLYICRVGKGSRFSDGDLGRVGLIFLVPDEKAKPKDRRHAVQLFGIRLGSTKDGVTFNRLSEPVRWCWNGDLHLEKNHLCIEYDLDNGHAPLTTYETVWPAENREDWKGEFHGKSDNGDDIQGTVQHIRCVPGMIKPLEFDGIDTDFWQLLEPQQIGEWGRRIYRNLPKSEQATKDEPFVIIDVISGKHFRVKKEDKIAAQMQFKAENPMAIPYCAEQARTQGSFGVGPTL